MSDEFPCRIAVLSVHTSPLDQPGAGDAGGLNVYVVETAKRLAHLGYEVEIFTRATSGAQAPIERLTDGVLVRHVIAGPFEGLGKSDLPAQLCAFSAAVLRAEATREPGWYDLIHSHYWLSGQVGYLARDRWSVPLVHSAHTLAKVKNAALADGELPEPLARIVGEEQVVAEADRLVAPTAAEAAQLIDLYGADPERVVTVPPGVDLRTFSPGSQAEARARLGIPMAASLALFVGRLQPLKAPDVLIRAAARIIRDRTDVTDPLYVAIVGAPSGGNADNYLRGLRALAGSLGVADRIHFVEPVDRVGLADYYRAADVCVVPSYNESFGLVALEAQACGTPVVATAVGGLTTAVADGVSGLLVAGHDTSDWARAIGDVLSDPARRQLLGKGGRVHAEQFSWDRTTAELIDVYREAMTSFRARYESHRS